MRDFGVAAVRGENAPRLRLLNRFFIITALALVTCAPQVWAGSCRKSGEWCSQGGGTRTINGVPVYRDCWEYTETFECVDDASVDSLFEESTSLMKLNSASHSHLDRREGRKT